ncbi:hypothetical protein Hamer_G017423 [Homarus americanus]|uniref:Uncharacterized protein n=1 Tax=Homarus americanus TaxID=6706 RepID=A0A8J5MQG2_HOMAM|nr:hypothetical protein Hamer_G017423 [Homarus americanus]
MLWLGSLRPEFGPCLVDMAAPVDLQLSSGPSTLDLNSGVQKTSCVRHPICRSSSNSAWMTRKGCSE